MTKDEPKDEPKSVYWRNLVYTLILEMLVQIFYWYRLYFRGKISWTEACRSSWCKVWVTWDSVCWADRMGRT